jgi:uncharacterized protein YneF (UPF0154 family)
MGFKINHGIIESIERSLPALTHTSGNEQQIEYSVLIAVIIIAGLAIFYYFNRKNPNVKRLLFSDDRTNYEKSESKFNWKDLWWVVILGLVFLGFFIVNNYVND